MTNWRFVLLVATSVFGMTGWAADKDAQADAEARLLKGTWTAVEGVRDGKKMTKDELAKVVLVFKGPEDGRFYSFTDVRPLIDASSAKAVGFSLQPWESPKEFLIDRNEGGKASAPRHLRTERRHPAPVRRLPVGPGRTGATGATERVHCSGGVGADAAHPQTRQSEVTATTNPTPLRSDKCAR